MVPAGSRARTCCGVWDNRLALPASCPTCRTPGILAVRARREASLSRGRPTVYNAPAAVDAALASGLGLLIPAMLIGPVVGWFTRSVPLAMLVLMSPLVIHPLQPLLARRRIAALYDRAAAAEFRLCPLCLHRLGVPDEGIAVCPECGGTGIAEDIEAHWRSLSAIAGRPHSTGRPSRPS